VLLWLILLKPALLSIDLLPIDHKRISMKIKPRFVFFIVFWLILTILACSLGSIASNPSMSAPPSPTSIGTGPTPDLLSRPQIWFGPLDPTPPNADRPYSGELDFFNLFKEDAPWQRAAAGIHVFKLYGGWLDRNATNAELKQVIGDLKRRGLGIAFEGGPLTPTAICTGVIEGFAGPREGGNDAFRIQQAGGTLDYVDLEHPYDAVTFSNAPEACRYSPERAAQDVARYVQAIRKIFPEARFGAIETANHDPQEVAKWVDAYRAVMGEDLAYFSFDLNYYRPDWAREARAIEDYLRGRGIEFGMFYRGDETAATDAEWVAKAEQRFVEYEVIAGGHPDRAIFQSWHPHPERLLPESDPTTFTYLINRYLRTRTALTVEAQMSASGSLTLDGILTDEHGSPLSKATIELQMTPIEGAGLVYAYTVSGTVPDGAIQADVGYRVNTECNCSAASDFTLYELRYNESAGGANQVPNGNFTRGMNGWGAWGQAAWEIVASDQGPGRALHVRAQPGQDAAINSANFATTPGSPFTVTFVARVSSLSKGSGYFSVVFLNSSQELRRFRIPLEAAKVLLGEAITDQTGGFKFSVEAAPNSQTSFRAWYAGDNTYWPAYAEAIVAGQ
jgi:hypothetical protein